MALVLSLRDNIAKRKNFGKKFRMSWAVKRIRMAAF